MLVKGELSDLLNTKLLVERLSIADLECVKFDRSESKVSTSRHLQQHAYGQSGEKYKLLRLKHKRARSAGRPGPKFSVYRANSNISISSM